jgi:plastocyanin
MNNKIIALIAIAVVAIGGWLIYGRGEAPAGLDITGATVPAEGENLNNDETPNTGNSTVDTEIPGTTKEFTITGSSFSFAPNAITVNKGDTVKITFKNANGFHDLVIDEFNARTQKINGGQSETITFVADKAGTFEYYCSVGTHRQMGMVGTLTVK